MIVENLLNNILDSMAVIDNSTKKWQDGEVVSRLAHIQEIVSANLAPAPIYAEVA